MDGNTPVNLECTLHVGCPTHCDYCPQDILRERYKGPRDFTLATFQQCVRTVPKWRQLAMTGFGEPFACPDGAEIMVWAHEQGYKLVLSTSFVGLTHEKIDRVAHIPFVWNALHVPALDGRMRVRVDDDYISRLDHALAAWKWQPDLIPSRFGSPSNPRIEATFAKHGFHLPHFGLHDRAGLISWLPHQRINGPVPLCGKMFCGNVLPNGDICLCCDDYGLQHVFGNLLTEDYAAIYEGAKFKKFLSDCQDPQSEVICRYCGDNSKQGWNKDHLPPEVHTQPAFGFGPLKDVYGVASPNPRNT